MGVQQLFIALYVIEVMLNFYIKRLRSLKKWWDNFGKPLTNRYIGSGIIFSSSSISGYIDYAVKVMNKTFSLVEYQSANSTSHMHMFFCDFFCRLVIMIFIPMLP